MTPEEIADQAIGLFLEYRDQHGYSEFNARWVAVNEVREGLSDETAQALLEIAAEREASS